MVFKMYLVHYTRQKSFNFIHIPNSSECEYNYDYLTSMVAVYSTRVHILEQNKGLNVYIMTAVIFLLNSGEEAHLMNAKDGLIKFHNYYAAIYTF